MIVGKFKIMRPGWTWMDVCDLWQGTVDSYKILPLVWRLSHVDTRIRVACIRMIATCSG